MLSPVIHAARRAPTGPDSRREAAALVRQTERLDALVPFAIMGVFIGMPLVTGLHAGHPILAAINALLLGLVATLLCRLVASVLLSPLRALRYRAAASALARMLDAAPDAGFARHWTQDAPGALALTRFSTLFLIDRSTDYHVRLIAGQDIVAVEVVTDDRIILSHRRRPAITFAARLGGGLIGAWTVGGGIRMTARHILSHNVALRYHVASGGPIATCFIPFGPDEHNAETLRLMLERSRSPRRS